MSTKDLAAMFGLELPARALCVVGKPEPIVAEDEQDQQQQQPQDHIHRFAVASASPRGNNSISLLEYIESRKAVECAAVWNHQQEIHSIVCSPTMLENKTFVLSTIHPPAAAVAGDEPAGGNNNTAVLPMSQVQKELSLFALPDSDQGGLHELRPIGTLPLDPVAVLWQPGATAPLVVSKNGGILLLSFAGGEDFAPVNVQHQCTLSEVVLGSSSGAGAGAATVTAASLDARGVGCFIALSSGKVVRVDLRAAQQQPSGATVPDEAVSVVTASAHAGTVRRIVNSEARLHCIVTVGDDGFVRGWDTSSSAAAAAQQQQQRKDAATGVATPALLFEYLAHHHAAMSIAINEHHTELAVTCGADRCTRLWRVSDLSSSSSSSSQNKASPSSVSCIRVSEQRDTVSSLAWSGAWVYASCSWDGAVTVDQVAFQTRSQLLLQ